jgi:hypothetical protein
MKKSMFLILTFLLIGGVALSAQEVEVTNDEVNKTIDEAMEEVNEALEEIESIKGFEPIVININRTSSNTPKMGVYLADMDFEDAYKMHYPYCYGVLVKGIVPGGPSQKAGIISGDIIMEFDGKKARFEDHLVKLIKSKNLGDEVEVKLFRDEEVLITKLVLSTLTHEGKEGIVITKDGKKKKKLSVGFGGGGWLPIWFKPDVSEFNVFLGKLGFDEETFSEDGFLIHGGGGKGNVGKGWFIGGMGCGYENSETTKHDWIHYKNGIEDTVKVSRKAKYKINYWGFTLDKRFALSRKFVTSLGFMIGWGHNSYKISQRDDNGDIGNFDFNDPSQDLDDYYDYESIIKLKSDYILFQPKAMMMWRILNWLSMRAEVGYIGSYSIDGWTAKFNGESVQLENEPDANMDGLTISIGPWFGF